VKAKSDWRYWSACLSKARGACHSLLRLSLCLLSLAGCTPGRQVPHNVLPSPPTDQVRNHFGTVGIIVTTAPSEEMSVELKLGSLIPARSGGDASSGAATLCQAGLIPCIAGLGVGVMMEVAEHAARDQNEIHQAESAAYRASSALTELAVRQRLRKSLVQTARDQAGREIKEFADQESADSDMILEINSYAVELLDLLSSFPDLTFRMVARIRLLQAATGQELYREDFEYLGRSAKPPVWGANDAQPLREEFERACQDLAEKITDTLFLLHRFPTTQAWNSPASRSGSNQEAPTNERRV